MTDDEKLKAACVELADAQLRLQSLGYTNISGATVERLSEIEEARARLEARQSGAICAIAAIKKRLAAAHEERLS